MKRTHWLADQVQQLSPAEFAEFRRWFLRYEQRADEHDTQHDREPCPRVAGVSAQVVEALSEYAHGPRLS